SDGSFTIAGCPPGKQMVTAEAKGFASSTVESELAENASPIQLTLPAGALLRLRVVDKDGHPVKKAYVWYDPFPRGPIDPKKIKPVQANVELRTDSQGRA